MTLDSVLRVIAGHPARLSILEIAAERPASPKRLAETIGVPLEVACEQADELDQAGLLERTPSDDYTAAPTWRAVVAQLRSLQPTPEKASGIDRNRR